MADVLNCVQNRVTSVDNENLEQPFTCEEVQNALFSMNPYKALGEDGFNMGFFQKC